MFNYRNKRMIKILNNAFIQPSRRFPGETCHGSPKVYLSPNGKCRAYVIPVQNPNTGRVENEIMIKSLKGKILFQKSYTSSEDEEGFFVVKARWTPDSRFFIYSMASSSRYRPSLFPTFFVSIGKVTWKADPGYFLYSASESCDGPHREFPTFSISGYKFKVYSLDDRIGSVISPLFRLCAPDTIKIMSISKSIKDQHLCKVSLSDLLKWR